VVSGRAGGRIEPERRIGPCPVQDVNVPAPLTHLWSRWTSNVQSLPCQDIDNGHLLLCL
jgi:hypothetical protein